MGESKEYMTLPEENGSINISAVSYTHLTLPTIA